MIGAIGAACVSSAGARFACWRYLLNAAAFVAILRMWLAVVPAGAPA